MQPFRGDAFNANYIPYDPYPPPYIPDATSGYLPFGQLQLQPQYTLGVSNGYPLYNHPQYQYQYVPEASAGYHPFQQAQFNFTSPKSSQNLPSLKTP